MAKNNLNPPTGVEPGRVVPAFLGNRRLLNSDHLAFHIGQLCRRLLVAANKEGCRPKDHNGGGGRQSVLGALARPAMR